MYCPVISWIKNIFYESVNEMFSAISVKESNYHESFLSVENDNVNSEIESNEQRNSEIMSKFLKCKMPVICSDS